MDGGPRADYAELERTALHCGMRDVLKRKVLIVLRNMPLR
jgi:hypothetical protein